MKRNNQGCKRIPDSLFCIIISMCGSQSRSFINRMVEMAFPIPQNGKMMWNQRYLGRIKIYVLHKSFLEPLRGVLNSYEYYLNLRQRRISREHMRNASDEVPELQKEKRSEMQL